VVGTDKSDVRPSRGFRSHRGCSVRASPPGGRPSQGCRASRSAPSDVAASLVPPHPPRRFHGREVFRQPASVRTPRPKTHGRTELPQASPPSQGSRHDAFTSHAWLDRPSWGFAPLQRLRPKRSVSPGPATPGTIRPRGFSPPRRVALPLDLRARWARCRSWGSDLADPFEREGRDASLRPLRPLVRGASQPSNSEEYEAVRSVDSKALEPVRPGSMAMVPEPGDPSPKHIILGPSRGLSPGSSPHALWPSASGRTMTRRAGAPGSLTDPRTSGSTGDPQLPWGFRCTRKTLWRLPMHCSAWYRHTLRSRKFPRACAPGRRSARSPEPLVPSVSPDYQRAICLGQHRRF